MINDPKGYEIHRKRGDKSPNAVDYKIALDGFAVRSDTTANLIEFTTALNYFIQSIQHCVLLTSFTHVYLAMDDNVAIFGTVETNDSEVLSSIESTMERLIKKLLIKK